ncbi:MAG TPA: hypothetical protein VKG45_14395 [Actinomycetes bacterium]|nr:hypothetical protein [Actinomycetes bacterium]
MYDPWHDPTYDSYDDSQYPGQYQPPPVRGYRSARNRRSSPAQVIPVIVLVVVLIGGVIGVARFLSTRGGGQTGIGQRAAQQAPRQQRPPAATTPATTVAPRGGPPAAQAQPGGAAGQQGNAAGGGAAAGGGGLVKNGQFEDDQGLTGWEKQDAVVQRVEPGWKSQRAVYIQPEPGAPATQFAQLLARGITRDAKGDTVTAAAWVRVPRSGIQVRIGLEEQGVAGDTVTVPIRDGGWHLVAVEHRMRTAGAVDLSVGAVGAPVGAGVVVDDVSAELERAAK